MDEQEELNSTSGEPNNYDDFLVEDEPTNELGETEEPITENEEKRESENLEPEVSEGLSSEVIEIINLESYINGIKSVRDQTREDLAKDLGALKEILAKTPAIAAEMAHRGLESAKDSIDSAVQGTKSTFKKAIGLVKEKAQRFVSTTKTKISDYKQNVHDGFEAIDNALETQEIGVAHAASEGHITDEEWVNAKQGEGRSEKVSNAVRFVQKNARSIKTKKSIFELRIEGTVKKLAAIFGPKATKKAIESIEKSGEIYSEQVSEKTTFGKVAERAAEMGFSMADGVRSARDDVSDKFDVAKGYAEVAKDKTKETVIKGAITLGKGTYKTVGTVAGTISFVGLEAAKVGRAVGRATKDKIIDPLKEQGRKAKENLIEKGQEVKETAINTKNFGSKFLDLAKNRFAQVKNFPTTTRDRASKMLKKVVEKVTPSLDAQRAAEQRREAVAQSREATTHAFNKLTGKEDKGDDGSR